MALSTKDVDYRQMEESRQRSLERDLGGKILAFGLERRDNSCRYSASYTIIDKLYEGVERESAAHPAICGPTVYSFLEISPTLN